MSLCDVKSRPTSAPPLIILITPLGRPVSWTNFANSINGAGANSDDFITTVLPAAKAGATFVAIKNICEFQGIMHAITPIGSLISTTSILGLSIFEMAISLFILSAKSA